MKHRVPRAWVSVPTWLAMALTASLVHATPEFRVNSYTTGYQRRPAVAMSDAGDFVVVWESESQDNGTEGVYGQRYDAFVAPLGGEFQVNTYSTSWQQSPAVAMDADGDFVVVWNSWEQDGSSYGIYGRLYDGSGGPPGGEFRVNTRTDGRQSEPSVAMDADGNFVVVWESHGQDGSSSGIYGQRFDALGSPSGTEFLVNTQTFEGQYSPSVAMDDDGDFVVVWQSWGQDGSEAGIYGQRYNASGVPQGSEFPVNTYTVGSQDMPWVAMDSDGDFVVVWQSAGKDSSGFAIAARLYDAAGVPQGDEFQVNTYEADDQKWPFVAMDADGDLVVTWGSVGEDGDGYGVYGQYFSAAGIPDGLEFQVNVHTPFDQYIPSVAMNAVGDFAVAWQSWYQDGSSYGVYSRHYVIPEPASFGLLGAAIMAVGYRRRRCRRAGGAGSGKTTPNC